MERDDSSLNKLSGIPELGNTLRWNNSSNVLCNYMKKQEYLDMVLQNFAIIPRYVIEPLDYLDLKEIKSICFPMTCFCDIPFSKVNTHMSNYGKYGIGLDKNAVLHKYRVQPIHYINAESPLTDDFKEAFSVCMKHNYRGDEGVLAAYISSTLMYMKPIWYYQKDTMEDAHFFSQLNFCLIENKAVVWKQPFSHFRVNNFSFEDSKLDEKDLIGTKTYSFEFIEGPIPATLLGAEFELYSLT